MNVMDFIPDYEAMTGKPLKPAVVEFWQHVHNSGMAFTRKGRMDAVTNNPPVTDDVFFEWAKNIIGGNSELTRHIGKIMKKYYFDGRNEVQ